jgi:hypothetical protein
MPYAHAYSHLGSIRDRGGKGTILFYHNHFCSLNTNEFKLGGGRAEEMKEKTGRPGSGRPLGVIGVF